MSNPLAPGIVRRSHYTIYQSGIGACYAVNGVTGSVDYSAIASADPAPVFQAAANALAQANGGPGGLIEARGQFTAANGLHFRSQLVLPPGVGFAGEGPLSAQPPQATGTIIDATYNGSVVVLTADVAGNTFSQIRDLTLRGSTTQAAQNLIEVNASGGSVLKDAYLTRVLCFRAGQYGVYNNNDGKLWLDGCYLESNIGDGINAPVGTIGIRNGCYIFGNTGNGINSSASTLSITDSYIWSNTGKGLLIPAGGNFIMTGCNVANNGAANDYQMQAGANTSITHDMAANVFTDSRGVNAVNHHIGFATSHPAFGAVNGNSFTGSKGTPVYVRALAANTINIQANDGLNNLSAKVATPFDATGRIGLEGTVAAPVASTTYKGCTPLMLAISGGVAVSITITDPAGNTVQSGLTSYNGFLPVGYGINLGAFTTAPTVYVGIA